MPWAASAASTPIVRAAEYPIWIKRAEVESWEKLPTLPDIRLLDTEYEEIKERVENGLDVELEFDIRNHFYKGPVKYHNVIAWIPGTAVLLFGLSAISFLGCGCVLCRCLELSY